MKWPRGRCFMGVSISALGCDDNTTESCPRTPQPQSRLRRQRTSSSSSTPATMKPGCVARCRGGGVGCVGRDVKCDGHNGKHGKYRTGLLSSNQRSLICVAVQYWRVDFALTYTHGPIDVDDDGKQPRPSISIIVCLEACLHRPTMPFG